TLGTTHLDLSSITLRQNELVALVGENGPGQPLLARLLTGLYLPTAGTVSWDGVDLSQVDPREVWSRVGLARAGQWPPAKTSRWPTTRRGLPRACRRLGGRGR